MWLPDSCEMDETGGIVPVSWPTKTNNNRHCVTDLTVKTIPASRWNQQLQFTDLPVSVSKQSGLSDFFGDNRMALKLLKN